MIDLNRLKKGVRGMEYTNTSDKHVFKNYMREVCVFKPLSIEEELKLFIELKKTNDEKVAQKIIQHNLLFVISVAKKYRNRPYGRVSITLEDLINEGNLGLCMALKNFDYTKGYRFITYAVHYIRLYISEYLKNNLTCVRIPKHSYDIILVARKQSQKLEQTLERKPTTLETFEAMLKNKKTKRCTGVKHLDSLLRAKMFEESLNTKMFDDVIELGETIKSDTLTPEEILIEKQKLEFISGLFKHLPYTTQEQIKDYYGLEGRQKLNLRELTEKYGELGETMRIRIKTALARVRVANLNNEKYYISA